MKYLLDTAPWINGVTLPQVFPDRIKELLSGAEVKGLCSISLLEAAILHRLRRLDFEGTLAQFFSLGLAADIQLLELTPVIAIKTNALPEQFHGDPFDRTIVATATVLNLTLVTSDPTIRDTRACTVEYYPFRPSRARS